MFLFGFNVEDSVLFEFPKNWPKPVYNFKKNSLTIEKITLGRHLFYDPILSKDNTISCASCHSPYNSFTHVDHPVSHGINDRIGTRNSPALMNLAWQQSFMWDGAVNHLDMQALGPISNPAEMDETIQHVIQKISTNSSYKKLFFDAYGDSLITGERFLKSLTQFMLTFVSSNSKYDRVQNAEIEFTEQEQRGYFLFKKNCNSCHIEPLFSNYSFANNGLPIDPNFKDEGRKKITHKSADSLKFKIPTLRNLEYSYPYMHDGRFKTLSEVISHYTDGIQSSKTLASQLNRKIKLNSHERVDLIAFLRTLSDKSYVFNAKLTYPKKNEGFK